MFTKTSQSFLLCLAVPSPSVEPRTFLSGCLISPTLPQVHILMTNLTNILVHTVFQCCNLSRSFKFDNALTMPGTVKVNTSFIFDVSLHLQGSREDLRRRVLDVVYHQENGVILIWNDVAVRRWLWASFRLSGILPNSSQHDFSA